MDIKLDKKDYQILHQLDQNSRQSDTEIGRKVGLSREVVKYRIKNLIKNNIIERFYTIIDVAKLGLISYKIYLQFQNLNKEKEEEMINFFSKHPNFEWLGSCHGKWDMIGGFWIDNIHKFNDIIIDFSDKYGSYIMNKAFTTTTGVYHYGKDYLIGKRLYHKHLGYFGGEAKKVELDYIDKEILKILANNARMPAVDIASKIKTTPRIIIYRIKELEKKGVIQSYRMTLNLKKLNYLFIKSFFYLQNLERKRISQLISFLATEPNIGWIIFCLGPWDMEVEFEIENIEKFDEKMRAIKEKFGDILKTVESVIITTDYSGTRYFPNCYGKIDKIYHNLFK